jgi:hypothetical protein
MRLTRRLRCAFVSHNPARELLYERDGEDRWRGYCLDCDATLGEWSEPTPTRHHVGAAPTAAPPGVKARGPGGAVGAANPYGAERAPGRSRLDLVLARWRRPRRVALVVDELAADPEELRGRPGTIVLFRLPDGRRQANVCCPGCGLGVFFNDGVRFPFLGPEATLSCPVKWTTPCCGWTGHLVYGWWRGR